LYLSWQKQCIVTPTTPYRRNVSVHCKKTDDGMKIEFLLHKDKKENGKSSPQKQECGCPSLQPSLRSHTHAFFAESLWITLD